MRRLVMLVVLLVSVMVSSCQQTCYQQTEEYRTAVDGLLDDWLDALAIADSTSRISLSGPIGELQDIQDEVEDLEVPECAETAHELLIHHMDDTIRGYLLFMGSADDEDVNNQFDIAQTRLESFTREYGRLNDPTR